MHNLQLINALLYIAENGCKWRALPKEFGNWHTIYVRMNRWSKNGVLQRVFEALQLENIIYGANIMKLLYINRVAFLYV